MLRTNLMFARRLWRLHTLPERSSMPGSAPESYRDLSEMPRNCHWQSTCNAGTGPETQRCCVASTAQTASIDQSHPLRRSWQSVGQHYT